MIPIIGDIIGAVGGIIDKVVPDADKRDQIKLELAQLEDQANARYHDELMGQVDVDKVEAAHPSVFVAGWRPFIGWSCGGAFIYNTMIAPAFHLPLADISFVQTVLMGMLGIAGMRTYEKVQGVATEGISLPALPPLPKIFGSKDKGSDQKTQDEVKQDTPPVKPAPIHSGPGQNWSKI